MSGEVCLIDGQVGIVQPMACSAEQGNAIAASIYVFAGVKVLPQVARCVNGSTYPAVLHLRVSQYWFSHLADRQTDYRHTDNTDGLNISHMHQTHGTKSPEKAVTSRQPSTQSGNR